MTDRQTAWRDTQPVLAIVRDTSRPLTGARWVDGDALSCSRGLPTNRIAEDSQDKPTAARRPISGAEDPTAGMVALTTLQYTSDLAWLYVQWAIASVMSVVEQAIQAICRARSALSLRALFRKKSSTNSTQMARQPGTVSARKDYTQ